MHNWFIVHILQRWNRLLDIVSCLLLTEFTLNYKNLTLFLKSLNRHWLQNSKIKYIFLQSWKNPKIFSTFGWFINVWSFISDRTCYYIPESFTLLLFRILIAQIILVRFYSAKYTLPNRPLPSFLPKLKLLIEKLVYLSAD